MIKHKIENSNLALVDFDDSHLTNRYISWLNDSDVVRYSEQRHLVHTRETCQHYVDSIRCQASQLFAIEVAAVGHIGNISVYYDLANAQAELSILVGEKSVWGLGYGSQAWSMMLDAVLSLMSIRKVKAGTMALNRPMLKIFEKSDMRVEAIVPKNFLLDGDEVDLILASKYKSNSTGR